MGKSKSTSSTKPIYNTQLTNAAGSVTNAFNAQQPKITGITDQLAGLVPGLMARYQAGDPDVEAASGYNQNVLAGKYLGGNEYLDKIVDQTAGQARNQTAAALGTRGLTGGSAFADIISRNVSDASNTLRFNDYNNERGRMDAAAGRAPSLAAAGEIPLASIMSILQAQQAPVSNAVGTGSAIGGLLGSYTNQTQTQKQGLGSLLAGLGGSALTGWATGGF